MVTVSAYNWMNSTEYIFPILSRTYNDSVSASHMYACMYVCKYQLSCVQYVFILLSLFLTCSMFMLYECCHCWHSVWGGVLNIQTIQTHIITFLLLSAISLSTFRCKFLMWLEFIQYKTKFCSQKCNKLFQIPIKFLNNNKKLLFTATVFMYLISVRVKSKYTTLSLSYGRERRRIFTNFLRVPSKWNFVVNRNKLPSVPIEKLNFLKVWHFIIQFKSNL